MYTILSIIVLGYSALVAMWAIFSFVMEIKNGFKSPQARFEMFQIMNKLHGKTTILLLFQILSVATMISWLALALPWIGVFTGVHLYSSFEGATLITPWGDFAGQAGNYYFLTVLVGIIAVKGYFVCKRMADILTNHHLAVSQIGQWGKKSDFN